MNKWSTDQLYSSQVNFFYKDDEKYHKLFFMLIKGAKQINNNKTSYYKSDSKLNGVSGVHYQRWEVG